MSQLTGDDIGEVPPRSIQNCQPVIGSRSYPHMTRSGPGRQAPWFLTYHHERTGLMDIDYFATLIIEGGGLMVLPFILAGAALLVGGGARQGLKGKFKLDEAAETESKAKARLNTAEHRLAQLFKTIDTKLTALNPSEG